MDNGQLKELLSTIVGGGGAGLIAYWIWGVLERNFAAVKDLSAEMKRYLTIVLTVVMAVLAYGGQLAMNYTPMPALATEWIEQVFSVAFLAVVTSQVVHGARQLRGRGTQPVPYAFD